MVLPFCDIKGDPSQLIDGDRPQASKWLDPSLSESSLISGISFLVALMSVST